MELKFLLNETQTLTIKTNHLFYFVNIFIYLLRFPW